MIHIIFIQRNIINILLIAMVFACSACTSHTKAVSQYDYVNILNIHGTPMPYTYAKPLKDTDKEGTNYINSFVDMGAWHGYYQTSIEHKELYGGFAGPYYIAEEYANNLSDVFNKIEIYDANTKELYDLAYSHATFEYLPGKLVQNYVLDTLILKESLIYVSNRTALIKVEIINTSDKALSLNINFRGTMYNEYQSYKNNTYISTKLNNKLVASNAGVEVIFDKKRDTWNYLMHNGAKFKITHDKPMLTKINGNSYISTMNTVIPKNSTLTHYMLESYTFNSDEEQSEIALSQKVLNNPELHFTHNQERWNAYLNTSITDKNNQYAKISVKAIETLITNWRSKAGAIKHDGITPSVSYKWFNGFWAWDSWKQAVATAHFDSELAKNNIRALFDYQIKKDDEIRPQDYGAIIDAVFFNKDKDRGGDGGNWNERNSKPPLASWAVFKVYETTGDKEFLIEMYDKLKLYHNWWYTNRDHDKNGVAEYGAMVHRLNNSQEEIIQAAAWESGMDNAIRFDVKGVGDDDYGVLVLENRVNGKLVGYSINQESVDLNAYLYQEKMYLAQMAEILGFDTDKEQYHKQAQALKHYINTYMYDKETGYYYDLQFDQKGNRKLLTNRGKGTEGFIPLFSMVADDDRAKAVALNILNTNIMNTYMPFPTASRDNPKFSPTEYWRGPVWLDQAYFGIVGLDNYGFKKEAIAMALKLVEHAEGLLGEGSIRENYNPLNGDGLHCTNFSWSASVYYLLYKDFIQEN